ncbi:MAG: hypothetical protein LPK06_00450 [Marinobacter sp.]|uniref:hypothetical protein n=1 Tax=Marinobacter sp. TaxID=50741 RepID=UPI0029C48A7B|nr:hypothetical protein [Marinobacter sp.]MDX5440801.1 hypothetical protein [Alteromonadaceae bacterium]MDX5327252.1 hypothetical protein [Marinobacter sp.]MDX5336675.1 hypothetical protein [Marinobacter sp.]MDX5387826.1 hypothetical protein [Marinobacter sp.]MDX5473127.1 hypothetical protein [Marinobacter sp.]
MAQYDFIIEGGRYFDGTGAPSSIRNMAFYNLPLRMLKLVHESIEEGEPIMTMEQVHWGDMENFDLQRLVNRNPGIVKTVIINGKLAVDDEQLAPALGREMGYGRFIPAR